MIQRHRLCTTLRQLAAGLALATAWTSIQAAERYFRWTDEQGQIHYADHIPDAAVRAGKDVINKRGLHVGHIERARTAAEIAAAEAAAQAEREAEKRAAAQAAYDRVLRATYTSVADIEKSRDDKVALLESQIRLLQGARQHDLDEQRELLQRAADLERLGREVPASISDRLRNLRGMVQRKERQIEAKRAEQAEFRERYQVEIDRYRELLRLEAAADAQ